MVVAEILRQSSVTRLNLLHAHSQPMTHSQLTVTPSREHRKTEGLHCTLSLSPTICELPHQSSVKQPCIIGNPGPLCYSSIFGYPGVTHYVTLPSSIIQVRPIMLLFHPGLPRHDPLCYFSILNNPGMTQYVTLPSSVTQTWPIVTLISLVTQAWPTWHHVTLPSLVTQVRPLMLLFHPWLPRCDPLCYSFILRNPSMMHYGTLPSSVPRHDPLCSFSIFGSPGVTLYATFPS